MSALTSIITEILRNIYKLSAEINRQSPTKADIEALKEVNIVINTILNHQIKG